MTSHQKLRIGTRGSALALRQTGIVAEKIKLRYPDWEIEVLPIKTKGDVLSNVSLMEIGGKGVFVKELEEAVLGGMVDIAVHSAKDVPAILLAGLQIIAVPEREDVRDVLVAKDNRKLERMPRKARIGTGSLRRACQLEALLPGLEIVPLRGNIDTRIRRGREGDLDGVILAAAGIKRMGWNEAITQFIPIETMLPAVGQGALCLEARAERTELRDALSFLNDVHTEKTLAAERAFLAQMGGSCHLPLAAYAQITDKGMLIKGLIGSHSGGEIVRDEVHGNIADFRQLGEELANRLLANGGMRLLTEAQRNIQKL
ncbi:MAG: hydroxymethylbilane synthase [Deltaproteobacteria bacterium]|nr:hydroxymethylbilane synthase [Deltaproteobacteria bacterium]